MSELNSLAIINPAMLEDDLQGETLINTNYDESINYSYSSDTIELNDSGYGDDDGENIREEYDLSVRMPPPPPSYKKILYLHDENFGYIKDDLTRIMVANAWEAINLTELWEFVEGDIESFMFSNDKRIDVITNKMEELGYSGHSGFSFGCTLRYMQYLARNGEEEFKKVFC